MGAHTELGRDYLYAIDQNRTYKWIDQIPGAIQSTFGIGVDGTIYMAAQSSLYAFNFGETLKWEYPTNNSGIISSPAISSDGAIYFGCDYGHLYALNSDGTLRWRYQTGGAIQSSPAIAADGMIYFGSDTVIYMLSMV